MEKHRVSCICYLSKTHFVRDFLQNSIGNSSTSTTCNPIYNAGTILQLQITMEFCRPHMHEKQLKPHLQCGTDPRPIREYPSMIRPHTRPSRTRRTAEVDHRGSGTDFVWKNIGFRASAISQRRISCETSSKTPSATHPPAPLATPFTMRGNDPTVANHNGILSTTHARKTVETPFTMRNRSETDPRISEHDPTTHETVSHPSHRRGRSSTFGDGLCMEKHRVSCICYLSKTHFVRDFLQNSIGNSSTSTTCNPIYNAGTILQLQITMEFCRPHMHEKQLKPHLQCGTGPRPIREYPSMIRPHTRPSRTRRTAEVDHRSRFGDGLCMEKHRVSCICYLSKTHFVRDFLQNSIGNSSTSTTCNPIYNAGTILQLQITMEFCRPHMHEKQLKPHLQCGTDPRPIREYPSMIRPHTRPSRTVSLTNSFFD